MSTNSNSTSNDETIEPRIDIVECRDCGAKLIGARTKHQLMPVEPEPCEEGTVALRINTTTPPFAIELQDDEEFLLARATDEPLFSPHRCTHRPSSPASSPPGSPQRHSTAPSSPTPLPDP